MVNLFATTIEKTGRYGFLLASICLMIGLNPFLDAWVEKDLLTDIFFTCILIAGIHALDRDRLSFRISCGLMASIIIFKVLHHSFGKVQYLHLLELMMTILFILHLWWMMLKHIITEKKVTADIIMGGACAFVLMGFAWGFAYYFLQIIHPDSLKGSAPLNTDASDFIYFSFVTLTSTGYGDILPISPQARALAVLEAIFGQLYLAIMISHLVSLHISDSQSK